MDPDLVELFEEGDGEDKIAAIIRLTQPDAVPSSVDVITQVGNLITARLPRREIPRVKQAVVSIKAGPPRNDLRFYPDVEWDNTDSLPENDTSIVWNDERRPPGLEFTGAGVIFGC